MAYSEKNIKLINKQRKLSMRGLASQYENTEACFSFYDGDSMGYKEQIQFVDDRGQRKRAMVNFNKVQSNVDAVVGFMAQNRRQAKYVARTQDQNQAVYSKYMNALKDFHRERTNADHLETDQDSDMLVAGYGAIETDLSYIVGNAASSPNGDIIKVKLDPMKVGWDPNARAKNLIDAAWVYYYDDYDLDQALDLFQGSTEEDFQPVGDEESGDQGYEYNPWGGKYDKIKRIDNVEWSAKEQNMVRVYNHQWFEYETFYKAENPIYAAEELIDAQFIALKLKTIAASIKDNGPDKVPVQDSFAFDPMAEQLVFDEKTKGQLMAALGDVLEPVSFKRKVYKTCVYSGEHEFTCFKSVSQSGFSVKFKTGTFSQTNKIWYGMVNSMMQPQKYYNKALTELMFTIAANSKGGVMVEEDAVEDISDFESKWAKTDAVIKVRSGAIAGNKIMQKTQGALPTGLENIITLSDAAISQAGVDPSFLGNPNDMEESGILYKRRIRQVISKMAKYFDSITMFQKESARLDADLIRVWVENNNGEWVRITGAENKDEFLQVSEDKLAPDYDVSIQEAPQTPEDQQATAQVLGTYAQNLIQFNPQAAMAFYAESVNSTNLDEDIKQRLVEALKPKDDMVPAAQVQQLQAQLQELQGQLNQANVAVLTSQAQLNQAKAATEAVKMQTEHANTAKTLEEATRTGLENDLLTSGDYEPPSVNI